jgi:hypothetical protein
MPYSDYGGQGASGSEDQAYAADALGRPTPDHTREACMKRHPEREAAVLNGLVVLLLPLSVMLAGAYLLNGDSDTSTTVRAYPRSVYSLVAPLGWTALVLMPFAAGAGWRTWVHTKRWRDGRGTGWTGVTEAGATGLAVALIILAPGIATRPTEAPPYVIVYGGAALILGLLVGLLLRTTALLFLTLRQIRPA